jgi:type VI secretion system Hcp family effector
LAIVSPVGHKSPDDGLRRFRFRVVAADGREVISDVVEVSFPTAQMIGYPPPAAIPPSDGADAKSTEKETPAYPVRSIFVSGKGKELGALKGESPRYDKRDRFEALRLDHDVSLTAAGKRQHHPLELTKQWGAASPQLFSALVTSEVLETVLIECYGDSPNGEEAIAHTIKLTNAQVVGIRQFTAKLRSASVDMETVGFAFEKIEYSSAKGKTLAFDEIGNE